VCVLASGRVAFGTATGIVRVVDLAGEQQRYPVPVSSRDAAWKPSTAELALVRTERPLGPVAPASALDADDFDWRALASRWSEIVAKMRESGSRTTAGRPEPKKNSAGEHNAQDRAAPREPPAPLEPVTLQTVFPPPLPPRAHPRTGHEAVAMMLRVAAQLDAGVDTSEATSAARTLGLTSGELFYRAVGVTGVAWTSGLNWGVAGCCFGVFFFFCFFLFFFWSFTGAQIHYFPAPLPPLRPGRDS
jgi:hypothetical protein